MKKHHLLLLSLIVLAGCSSIRNISEAFTTRKYTKGYFNNIPAPIPSVVSKLSNHTDSKSNAPVTAFRNKTNSSASIPNIAPALISEKKIQIQYIPATETRITKPVSKTETIADKDESIDSKNSTNKTTSSDDLAVFLLYMFLILGLALLVIGIIVLIHALLGLLFLLLGLLLLILLVFMFLAIGKGMADM